MNASKRLGRAVFYLLVIGLVLFSIGPIIWMLLSSLRPKVEFFAIPPTFLPKRWTLENYFSVFRETEFVRFLMNSIWISIGAIVISTVVGVSAAYSLTRFQYRGRKLFSVFSLFAYMLPSILLVIPLYLIAVQLKLTDKLSGLVLAYVALCLPYCIWVLCSFFETLPIELEESAFIDGCGRVRALFHVALPMLIPGIIAVIVFTFTYVWNEYLFALVFINSDAKRTFPVGLESFVTSFDVYWEYILSGSIIVSIPAVVIFLVTQRSLIKGYGAGAIKG
ncbi:carbohydrate ABC transporter membrane protein 2 (CUT1 family) [Hydrogenispora ethanolica]|jgi:multiple sugar transport system permease protein|uniref:Carbohydrate ABC transporter membrane protein 2 (CUT1 family) n=1 Tax=Hydrogenispora ethanolica TaxID=1082276 RepID=A0A4R1RUF6_HYDET|nr:carbohydrate ABC transporter permease [Hydrogenispora ethanolica]TCL70039.1 carbohydrate ABC transporter membrane protein 2 (CUT1 family) [Hydrogenispora ethanolica]